MYYSYVETVLFCIRVYRDIISATYSQLVQKIAPIREERERQLERENESVCYRNYIEMSKVRYNVNKWVT